jgi:hypothetical protein
VVSLSKRISTKCEESRSSNKSKRWREDHKVEGQGVSLMVWVVEGEESRCYCPEEGVRR